MKKFAIMSALSMLLPVMGMTADHKAEAAFKAKDTRCECCASCTECPRESCPMDGTTCCCKKDEE